MQGMCVIYMYKQVPGSVKSWGVLSVLWHSIIGGLILTCDSGSSTQQPALLSTCDLKILLMCLFREGLMVIIVENHC